MSDLLGIGGHQSAAAKTTDWITPPAVIDAIGGAISFDLDPCASVTQPWPTARRCYTKADNGLALPWDGRVWLNPPYSTAEIAQWLGRLAEHGCGTALIFARTETDCFFRHVWARAAAVLFLRGRLHFHYPDGRRAAANSGAPSVLVAYGLDDADILACTTLAGQFVPLRLPRSVLVEALRSTWRAALADWIGQQDGPVELAELYRAFLNHPKAKSNSHYREKIRQTLRRGGFRRVGPGLYGKE